MQPDDLQHIVDTLASKLRRSVSVDDPSMRLLVASKHFGDEDPARIRSILDRYAGEDAVGFVLSHGISRWEGPGRLPAHPPALASRWCIPVRCHGLLLGYVWLIDPDGAITDGEVGLAADAAEQIGLLLYRRLLLHEREQARIGSLLRDLVSVDHAARVRAAEEMVDDDLLAARDHIVVLAFEVTGASARSDRDEASVALSAAMEGAARGQRTGGTLSLAQGSRGFMVLGAAAPIAETTIGDVVQAVQRGFAGRVDGSMLLVGVGGARHGLARVVGSHREAVTAVRAARLLPELGPVAHWERLGPYALLLQLPPQSLVSQDWLPGLKRLQAADSRGTLIRTLEAFLDYAGDVQRTARQLRVHRTTLYHRLHRIEQVASVDLWNGVDRLGLHLGLRLARLTEATRSLGTDDAEEPQASM